MSIPENRSSLHEIAIIGMAGRFPGARNVDEFWRNLRDGVESISFFTDEELLASGVADAFLEAPNYVKANGVLDDIDLFDASFFGFTASEAEITDPQQRLFLECAFEALENAGYAGPATDQAIGVYAGASLSAYLVHLFTTNALNDGVGIFRAVIGNDKDSLPTWVSYKLDLKGPSVAVQTSCSTSLVAVHMACQALLNGECDVALAGGASVRVLNRSGYFYEEGGITSPDGHCRAFDARAQGTVAGNGVALVVLKPLAAALRDGDYIHAVIKGSAINNDGSAKIGYTAPSIEGQAQVIAEAQAVAGVEPKTVSYVEAHGTATALGDPIEVAALTRVFQADTDEKAFCGLGAVKTNIGHLDTVAGVAGLIKTALALKHKQIPPSLHFERPNPLLELERGPFYVNAGLSPWKNGTAPRRAGVNSFGIGGTNAHVVVEEAPARLPSGESRPLQLLMLSAKTRTALETATANLADHLKQHAAINLADVAYTLQVGRANFAHRRVVVCRDHDDAVRALEQRDAGRVLTASRPAAALPVIFMFPGQGSQYLDMCKGLYAEEPLFRAEIDRCAELLKPHIGLDLRDVIYPTESDRDEAARQLKRTRVAQPAMFVVEYALARLWMKWGVRPDKMIGHSLGEYAAACVAGVFSLSDALAIVATRARLVEELPAGAMLSVSLTESEVRGYLDEELSLAVVNAPELCVVSGTERAIAALEERLTGRELTCTRLRASHAFHSTQMRPIAAPFADFLKTIRFQPPGIPYLSNVTGTWIKAAEATDPTYWVDHLLKTARFADGVQEALKESPAVMLEVGPSTTLANLVGLQAAGHDKTTIVSSARHPKDHQPDGAFLMRALGRLWLAGVRPDWSEFYAGERRYRLPLPSYPFERRRYWATPRSQDQREAGRPSPRQKNTGPADWLYAPSWQRALPLSLRKPSRPLNEQGPFLLFADERGLGRRVADYLARTGAQVTVVVAGDRFHQLNDDLYAINPGQKEDYHALTRGLRDKGRIPKSILHLWNVTAAGPADPADQESAERRLSLSFYSLLFLAQAVGNEKVAEPIHMLIVANNTQSVNGDEVIIPEKATLFGPANVIPMEYAALTCTSIDVSLEDSRSAFDETLVEQLLQELACPANAVVAYRGNSRWLPVFEHLDLENTALSPSPLREQGVYLITGGLGGVGLVLARHLAETARARLILLGRSEFPARARWAEWLASHDDADEVSRKIGELQELESLGARLLVVSADVTDGGQTREAVASGLKEFGELHGVIHAAGIAGGGLMEVRTPEAAAAVLAAKVRGTRALAEAVGDLNLDFFLLCSSASSITGAFGQVDYCAANAFLDAFAHEQSRLGRRTLAVNWARWRQVGMAVNAAVPAGLKKIHEESLKDGLLSSQGTTIFDHALRMTLPQFVVSLQDFNATVEQQRRHSPFKADVQADPEELKPAQPLHARPELASHYLAPGTEVEQALAEVWQESFGINQIGVNDNFFELGGHSLLGLQMMSRIRSRFHMELPLRLLFESPTVAGLAEVIAQNSPEQKEAQELSRLLQEIEGLSEEELVQALANEIETGPGGSFNE